eukprot:scaffold1629_cov369-Prasinococcus_capsulatus_cf.AAC.14
MAPSTPDSASTVPSVEPSSTTTTLPAQTRRPQLAPDTLHDKRPALGVPHILTSHVLHLGVALLEPANTC